MVLVGDGSDSSERETCVKWNKWTLERLELSASGATRAGPSKIYLVSARA